MRTRLPKKLMYLSPIPPLIDHYFPTATSVTLFAPLCGFTWKDEDLLNIRYIAHYLESKTLGKHFELVH